jgi:flagellar motor component MotA
LELFQNKRVPSTMANIQQTLRHLFEINQKYRRETQVLTILYELAIPARRNGLEVWIGQTICWMRSEQRAIVDVEHTYLRKTKSG